MSFQNVCSCYNIVMFMLENNFYPTVNRKLQTYIQQNVFPQYAQNEPAHNLKHIKYVIERSINLAQKLTDVNLDIVYTVAAYHDLGHHIDPAKHEIISARMMSEDKHLPDFFSGKQLKLIKEAIEDHRASSNHEPRSVYGKIVSTADRNTSVEDCLYRSFVYGKNLHPDFSDEQLFVRSWQHLKEKFGEGGYAKYFFSDPEYERFLNEIRTLLADKELFMRVQREYMERARRQR